MLRLLFFIVALCSFLNLRSQGNNEVLDSLLKQSKSGEKIERMHAYLSLADYYVLGDTNKMLLYLNKVDSLEDYPDSTRRAILYEKVEVLKKTNRLNEALGILKSELKKAEVQNDLQEQASIHKNLSSCYFFMNDLDSAEIEVNNAADLYLQLQDSVNYGIMLLRIGNIYYLRGDYERSIEFGIEAKNVFSEIGHVKQLAVTYLHVGNIFFLLEDYKNAGDFYNKARSQFLKAGDLLGNARALLNYGLVHLELDNAVKSIELYKEALPVMLSEGRYSDQSQLYNFMAEAYLDLKEYDSTILYIEKAVEIDKMIHNEQGLSQNYFLLALLNFELEDIDQATKFGHMSLNLLNGIEAKEHKKNIYELLYQIYENQKEYENAFLYLKEFVKVSDSLTLDDVATRKKAMDERAQLEAANFELKLLSQKKDLILSENKLQKKYLTGISLIAVFAIILVAMLLRSNNKNKILNFKLKSNQDRIKEDLKIKESLLKEIHHRVKNNLQIISSMLSIQDQHLNDSRFAEVITECKNRINSMSLIHESLYKSNDLYEEHFSSYVTKLVKQLMKTYHINDSKVKLKMDLENFYLGLDDSVPAGLMINEIVSNCIKHAFNHQDDGEIAIVLRKADNRISLSISDNGIGMDKKNDLKDAETFGLLLISLLASQLDAEVTVNTDGGTEYRISWKQKEDLLRYAV